MKQLKARAWDGSKFIYTNDMPEDWFLAHNIAMDTLQFCRVNKHDEEIGFSVSVDWLPLQLSSYVSDSNGVGIYEGDILYSEGYW